MTKPLRIGIAGLGTVGRGVVKILHKNKNLLRKRARRPIEVIAVSAKNKAKNRGISLESYNWENDPRVLACREDIDVFVELIGGHEGIAIEATKAAINSGKDVITANKAMLAHHGHELALQAESKGSAIRFEAAVAGGIPVVKCLTEGLAGNNVDRIIGVMNGTCNYILTRMESSGLSFEDIFAEAADLGYLEADPNLDVGGIDAGHKLSILASIAFGSQVNFGSVELEGINQISVEDIRQAADMGFRIKLLGIAKMTSRGLEQRMSPCLVPAESPLGQLEGGTNMIILEGDQVGQIILRGQGAGESPTSSAVLADIIDLAREIRPPIFGQPAKELTLFPPAKSESQTPFYLRLQLLDQPGALSKVAAILGKSDVSIDRMRQYGHDDETAPLVILTHKTTRESVDSAVSALPETRVLKGNPVALRIENV